MPKAFPGAEGWGAGTQGARAHGGTPTIYVVSNLNNSGSGSFRAACEASGPRVVVFKVAGYIPVNSTIDIDNPYITILGQTAPAPGVILYRNYDQSDPLLDINADEVIIRYLRFFHGEHRSVPGKSGDVVQQGDGGNQPENLILDHCEFGGSTDETVAFWDGGNSITMQWCILHDCIHFGGQEENLERGHGHGCIVRNEKVSLHHNLYVNTRNRTPARVKSVTSDVTEVVANVCYNMGWISNDWGAFFIRNEENPTQNVNAINNVFLPGPDRTTRSGYAIDVRKKQSGSCNVYESGTKIFEEDGSDVTGDSGYPIFRPGGSETVKASAISVSHSYPITTDNATAEMERVLDGAGVTVPQRWKFTVDMVKGVRGRTRRYALYDEKEIGWPPAITPASSWADTNSDGLPDYYEVQNDVAIGTLDPTDTGASGYLVVEEWANSISGDVDSSGGDPDTGGSGGGGVEQPANDGDLTLFVAAGADDAYVHSGTTTPTHSSDGTRIFAGHFDANEYNIKALMRFTGVEILNASDISEAYLRIYVSGVNTAAPGLRIYALDEDNSGDLDDETDVNTRLGSLTTAYVEWTPSSTLDNQWASSPNIATVLEEVVARSGWVSGNALTIVLQDADATYSSEERLKIGSYDSDPNLAAILDISGIEAPQGTAPTGTTGSVDLQIASSGNDGYVRGEDSYFDNTNVRVYAGDTDTTGDYGAFLLFEELGIPQGATIDSAYMQIRVSSLRSVDPSVIFYGEDADDPIAPTTYADYAGRTKTTASVAWNPTGLSTGTWYDTPSLVDVIQEIVDRVGWTDTSNLMIMVEDASAGDSGVDRRIGWDSYDDAPTNSSRLIIGWTDGTSGTAVAQAVFKAVAIGTEIGLQPAF